MARSSQFNNASSTDEARALIRQCAEPRRVGELVKETIFRTSRRLDLPISRTRDIWYGDARRIYAEEMDRLRRGAEEAELAQALAAIELVKNKALASSSDEAVTKLRAALLAFQGDPVGEPASSP
jgi:hypothetical protein